MKLFNKKVADLTSEPRGIGRILHRIGRDPYMDWSLSIGISFVVCIVLLFVGYLKFKDFDLKIENIKKSSGSIETGSVNTKLLNDIFNKFDNKNIISEQFSKTYLGQLDPSI